MREPGTFKEKLARRLQMIAHDGCKACVIAADPPNRFRGAYGAARAAEAAGNRTLAAKYYKQVLTIAQGADGKRPELQRARSFTN